MIAIDTNVLIRYLVQDDPAQGGLATRLIERAAERGEPVHLSMIVLCEAVWVLRRVYRVARPDVLAALQRILRAGEPDPPDSDRRAFIIENEASVRQAVGDYAAGPADFADYLIGRVAHAAGAATTYTFDRTAATASTFKLLRR